MITITVIINRDKIKAVKIGLFNLKNPFNTIYLKKHCRNKYLFFITKIRIK